MWLQRIILGLVVVSFLLVALIALLQDLYGILD
jgi:hypothetical protein